MAALSLLCRGNAQVVTPLQEKLEVRYEPQDYFNWKSRQNIHIRRFLSGKYASYRYWEFPTPKTYITRKGALVLYSEDLALPSWSVSQVRRLKKKHHHRRKKFELELSTLQDFAGAILAYGRKQKDDTESHWQPYLHFLNEEGIPSDRQIRPGYSPKRYLTRLFQTWDPNAIYKLQQEGSLRDSAQLQQLTASSGDSSGRLPDLSPYPLKYQRLPVFTSLPQWTNAEMYTSTGRCTPVEEESGNDEGLDNDMDIFGKYGKKSEVPLSSTEAFITPGTERTKSHVQQKFREHCETQMGEVQPSPLFRDDQASNRTDHSEKSAVPVEVFFSKDKIPHHHGKPHTTFYGGSFAGRCKYPNNFQPLPTGGFLPPISQSISQVPEELKDPNVKVQEHLKLPSITEEHFKVPKRRRRYQSDDPPKELLVIPLLVHFDNQKVNQEKKNISGNTNREPCKNKNQEAASIEPPVQNYIKENQACTLLVNDVQVAENRIKPLQMEIAWNVDSNTDANLPPVHEAAPPGLLPPINGRKGPGNQSSMANLKANNPGNTNSTTSNKSMPTGIIRGSIPEELKECCKGSSVGSLIMSPNGEIVCLSLMGAARDTDIPVRFDFIAEEEEEEEEEEDEDCLLMDSAGQEEQWSASQQDFEHEADCTSRPSSRLSTYTPERVISPPNNKGKNRKKISLPVTTSNEENGNQSGPLTNNQKSHRENKEEKDTKSGQKDTKVNEGTELRNQDKEDVRYAQVPSTKHIQEKKAVSLSQENIAYAEFTSETINETFSTSDFPNQNLGEDFAPPSDQKYPTQSPISGFENIQQDLPSIDRNQEMPIEAFESTPIKDQMQSHTSKPQNKDKILQETHQAKPEPPNLRPETQEARKPKKSTSPGTSTVNVQSQDSQQSEPTTPPTVQDKYSNKQEETSVKGSGKQPNTKQKTPETVKKQPSKAGREKSDNFKDVEKVPMERKEKVPAIPVQAEDATQAASHTAAQKLPVEDEMAPLEDITKTAKKEAAKRKGKAKTEKTQKPERADTRVGKKAKQGAAKEQGKSAFVVGQPKDKKVESTISYPKKTSEQVQRPQTTDKTQDTVEDLQEDTTSEKESEDAYVVHRYQEESPVSEESKDLQTGSGAELTMETASQGAQETADQPRTSTLEVPHQAEEDNAGSETSEITNSSINQRRSSRAHALSEKAERRRLEVERKRREREEQLLLEREQQERMEKIKEELEQEQRRRAEDIRLKKQQEEEEKQRLEQEKARKMQLEQQALERARQQQEEHRRKLQEIQRRKQQEEMERMELERQRLKEKELLEAEERMRLLEMAADEREEYNRQKREREEQARKEAEERRLKAEEEARAIMEEAQRRAQLLARQTAALEQQLQFHRGLLKESVGMDQTQGISRPWVFSYFEFLELLGLPLPVDGTKCSDGE